VDRIRMITSALIMICSLQRKPIVARHGRVLGIPVAGVRILELRPQNQYTRRRWKWKLAVHLVWMAMELASASASVKATRYQPPPTRIPKNTQSTSMPTWARAGTERTIPTSQTAAAVRAIPHVDVGAAP